MICDKHYPNCLVKACCSIRCDEINNNIKRMRLTINSAKDYYLGNMLKNMYCPVCHTNMFRYEITPLNYDVYMYVSCKFCDTRYQIKYTYGKQKGFNDLTLTNVHEFNKGYHSWHGVKDLQSIYNKLYKIINQMEKSKDEYM